MKSTASVEPQPFVALTDESTHETAEKPPVFIGRRIRHEATQRSDVLHAVKDTRGPAQLPARIAPEDVELWQAACLVRCEPSTEELATIVKVADALGDSECATWIAMLASRTLAINWHDPSRASAMLCTLLTLPSALLPRLLASCLSNAPLDSLLSDLPPVLHPPLIAAAATPAGLVAPSLNFQTFLSILPHTRFAFPGLIALQLPSSSPPPLAPATAALLAHAVSAHPCLTSLHLHQSSMHADALRAFHCCLTPGALPNLISFSVAAAIHPDGCAEIAHCLGRLSTLTALSVCLIFNEQQVAPNPSLDRYVRAAASPAALLHLPHLRLFEGHALGTAPPQPQGRSCCDLLLPLLAAPKLTSLEFITQAATASFPSFVAAIRHFTALQKLTIDADARDCDRNGSKAAGASATGIFQSRPSDERNLLPALRTLCITSSCHVAPLCMAAAIAQHAQHSLTRITVHHVHSGGGRPATRKVQPHELKEVWATFLPAIHCCPGLQQLDLPNLASVRGISEGRSWSEELCSALSHLPLVTRLTLRSACKQCSPGARCVLDGENVAKVLRVMPELRTFSLCGIEGALDVSAPKRVLAVLPGLYMLTSLGLCFTGVSRKQIVELLPQLPALVDLQVLEAVLGASEQERNELVAARSGLKVTAWTA